MEYGYDACRYHAGLLSLFSSYLLTDSFIPGVTSVLFSKCTDDPSNAVGNNNRRMSAFYLTETLLSGVSIWVVREILENYDSRSWGKQLKACLGPAA